jgi:hypothetical protein
MDESLSEVASRLDAIERELCVLRSRLAALSEGRGDARTAAERFLALREEVSREWAGGPSVLEEFRKSRGHDE